MIPSLTRRAVSKSVTEKCDLWLNIRCGNSVVKPSQSRLRWYAKKAEPVQTPKYAQSSGDGKKRSFVAKTGSSGVSSEPRGESLSSTIKQLNAVSDYAKAMEVWKQARARGVDPNEFVYATILSTFRHLSDYVGALEVYEEVKRKGIRNSFIDSQILDVYARKGETQAAVDLFYDMTTNTLDVKLYAFNSLIKALVADGRGGEAIGMVTQHSAFFAESDRNFWPSLVSTIVSTHDAAMCRDLLKHILESEIPLAQSTYLTFLHLFSNGSLNLESDVRLLNQLIDALKSQGTTGLATLIAFHTERNDAAGALDVWKQLKTQPKFFSVTAFTHLITVCAASGQLEDVEEIYKTMIASGYEASAPVLAAMIRLYAANIRIQDAQSHFDALLSQPSYVSPFLFNTMLDLYSDIGDENAALKIIERMKEKKMKFNVSIYNSLINLHLRTNHPEKAIEVYQQMKEEKLHLNFLTYKPLITASTQKLNREALLKEIDASTTISDLGKSILKQLGTTTKGKAKQQAL